MLHTTEKNENILIWPLTQLKKKRKKREIVHIKNYSIKIVKNNIELFVIKTVKLSSDC